MRVISGELKGRSFKAPRGYRTHPMAERIKSALFNTLADLRGKKVLDAFAGSGALGFESISRGAKSVQAVEIDNKAFSVIKQNVESLGLGDNYRITRANCVSWSSTNRTAKFDLIFADPPFDKLDVRTLAKLVRHLESEGTMVVSYSSKENTPVIDGLNVVDSRFYGDQAIAYYMRSNS